MTELTKTDDVLFPAELADSSKFKSYTDIVIKSDPDAAFVSDVRQQVKAQLKEIEKTRKEFTEPLLESKKRIDQKAKNISAPFEALVRVMDQKLIAWHTEQEDVRRKEAEAKRAQEIAQLEAQKKADLEAAMMGDEKAGENLAQTEKYLERAETKPIEISNAIKTKSSTTYLTQRWSFEIEDEALIPREFLMVDESKLRKYALALKDHAKVPGVRFFQEKMIGGRNG